MSLVRQQLLPTAMSLAPTTACVIFLPCLETPCSYL